MSELLVKLRALAAEDRRTAAIWRRQCDVYWPSAPRENVKRPPQPHGRSAVLNWCNWLDARAAELEQIILEAEASDR